MFSASQKKNFLLRRFFDLLLRSFWLPLFSSSLQIYGELSLEDMRALTKCEQPTFTDCHGDPGWFAALLLSVYLLVSTVLLVNLLIASMASTYERVTSEANQLWAYQNAELLLEVGEDWILPAPFNVFYNLYLLGSAALGPIFRKINCRNARVWPWLGEAVRSLHRGGRHRSAANRRPKSARSVMEDDEGGPLRPQTSAECRLMATSSEIFLANENAANSLAPVTNSMLEMRRELTSAQQMLLHVENQLRQAERRRVTVTSAPSVSTPDS